MFSKRLVISLSIFCFMIIFVSFIKNETRILEKKISKLEKRINYLKQNLNEAQLDFFYLSSPEVISNKIQEFSDENYTNTRFSQIYLSLKDFIDQQKNISSRYEDDKKKE